MQIKIKSARVVKTGETEKGKWELIVVAANDGTDYTTFNKGAKNIMSGSVIEFEPVIKGGKTSFTEYTVISVPEVSEASRSKVDPGMTPDLWAEKDRLERYSIESQVCFKGIVELAKSGVVGDKLADAYDAALDWALAHFKPPKEQSTALYNPLLDTKPEETDETLPEKGETLPKKGETPIDMDWLHDSLQKLGTSDTAFRSAVGGSYRVDTTGSWNDIIGRLTVEQQKGLVKRIEAALEKKTTKEE